MPTARDLPPSIASFERYMAQPLDDHSFEFHVSQIAGAVEDLSGRNAELDLASLMPGRWTLEIHYPNGFTTTADAEFRSQRQEFEVVGSFLLTGIWGVDPTGQLALEGRQVSRGPKRFGFLPHLRMPYAARIQFSQTSSTTYKGVASTGEWATWTKTG